MASSDTGLFGPDSMAWRVHADPSMIVGGMRALLLQALNPRAMAGVADHSAYRKDPWGRFARTAAFVATTTYGTTAEAEAIAARVRRVHLRVNGREPTTGATYSADDPDLLAWVHNVLAHSLLLAKQRYGGGLSRRDAEQYLREMVRMAELVGTPRDLVAYHRCRFGRLPASRPAGGHTRCAARQVGGAHPAPAPSPAGRVAGGRRGRCRAPPPAGPQPLRIVVVPSRRPRGPHRLDPRRRRPAPCAP